MFPLSSSLRLPLLLGSEASTWRSGSPFDLPQPNRSQLSFKKREHNKRGGVLSFGQLTVWLLVYEQTPAI